MANWEACEELEQIEEVIEELLEECFDERNRDACETLEELEEMFEGFEDDFESDDSGWSQVVEVQKRTTRTCRRVR